MVDLEGDHSTARLIEDRAFRGPDQDTVAIQAVVDRKYLGLAVDDQADPSDRCSGKQPEAFRSADLVQAGDPSRVGFW